MAPDNLTVSVIWGRLSAICEEMAEALQHTAFSDQVREGGDYSTAVFDADGRLLAQANRSPAHLGAMPSVVRHMLEYYAPGSLQPRDIIIMNDPYLGSGHLPDIFAMSPVFANNSLVGYVCCSVHVTDIGGYTPGSQAVVGVTDLIQEGLRILPTLLYRAGEPNKEILQMIGANVRVPELVLGDISAQRAALYVGALKLGQLVEKHGHDTVNAAADIFIDRSEQAVRTELAAIPDGTYKFSEYLDDMGPGTDPILLSVAVTIEGDAIIFDFSDSGPQVASSINCTLTYTAAYCYWAAKAITTRDTIPQNEGQLRPVTVTATPGTFFNPTPPAAVGARALLNQRIVELIFGALGPALPERVSAGSGQWINPIFGGLDPKSGRRFVYYDYAVAGVGARLTKDGVDAVSPIVSVENIPVEAQESRNPIVVERFELVTDSGGAGRTRGGLAVRKDVRMLADGVTLSNLTDRQRFPPYGLDGGVEGTLGLTILNRGTEGEEKLESKGTYVLRENDVISFQCSGSGGFGSPLERDHELVREDLREGRISAQAAREFYKFDPDEEGEIT